MSHTPSGGEPVFLTHIDLDSQAELFRSLLEDNGIPVLLRPQSAVDELARTYTGNTLGGSDLYVAPEQLEEARTLLEAYFSQEASFDYDADAFDPARRESETPDAPAGRTGGLLLALLPLLFGIYLFFSGHIPAALLCGIAAIFLYQKWQEP